MANLAIKGHANRGKEVIEILEMFGGKNVANYDGSNTRTFYFLNNIIICSSYGSGKLLGIDCYTLEEFLEEFPHKVGDKVLYKYDNTTYFIRKMFWENDKVLYELSDEVYSDGSSLPDQLIFNVGVTQLKPYKEETMEIPEKLMPKIDFNEYCKDKYILDLGNYEIKEENGKTYAVRKWLEYPKTYEECCKVLNICPNGDIVYSGNWVYGGEYLEKHLERIRIFQKLIICRDAYWKIAGEQMGLGKPWEPDFIHAIYTCTIICRSNKIVKDAGFDSDNRVLAFPTEEMRDAFYENFKDLIIECKELL